MKKPILSTPVIAVLCIAVIATSSAVTYIFSVSNTVNGDVTDQQISVSTQLTVNGSTATFTCSVGDTALLIAVLSPGVAGRSVEFKDSGATIVTRTTNASGIASYSYQPAQGAHSWTALPS